LDKDEQVVALTGLDPDGPGLALGTEQGVIKRVVPDHPQNKDTWEVISLKPGDQVVGAVELTTEERDLVFVTSDAQLLHFEAAAVRPQGRSAGGMAGVRLSAGARVVHFGAVDPALDNVVVTIAASSDALPGTDAGSVKVTPYTEYPAKGRGTGGVRCHRFLRGEDVLTLAWAGPAPARAAAATGVALDLPEATGRRDGSGVPASQPVAAVSGPAPVG
jgi:DNA gyrase subunit A